MKPTKLLNMLKLAFLAFGIIQSASCYFENHVAVENVLVQLRQFRDAEARFQAQNGRFGRPSELIEKGLVSTALFHVDEPAYEFHVNVADHEYEVVAKPKRDVGSYFYLDNTGIIRSSYSTEVPAISSSEAIKNQN
jgi:hypothetical protein